MGDICDRCGKDHDAIIFREALACILNVEDDVADVYVERICDRLAGYTHDEVIEMHPLPDEGA